MHGFAPHSIHDENILPSGQTVKILEGSASSSSSSAPPRASLSFFEEPLLLLTHPPQVAALGGHHWRVEKRQDAATTLSTVTALDDVAREDEIARMLSGDSITDEARAAARALLTAVPG